MSSTTEKKSKLTIPANNPVFNGELKCVATWTGNEGKAIETTSDVNAIGASMESHTFSSGVSGDGVMTCLVWGDSPPFSVSWKDSKEKSVANVENEVFAIFDSFVPLIDDDIFAELVNFK